MIKMNSLWVVVLGACAPLVFAQPSAPPPVPATPPAQAELAGPKITFATPVYDFGKVKSGDPVKYTFVFTNTGDQALEVKSVQPSCGCTTAGDWTKLVPAGETGNIPVQFNSANFNGQVFKTIAVGSNDRKTPTVILQLKGTVWKAIEMVPPYTVLNIPPDSPKTTAVVRIINNLEEPLTLSDPECNNKSFTATLEPVQPGKEFRVTISPVPPLNPGSVQGKVTLKTSMTNMPTLDVPFWANIQPALMVVPPQIVMPAAPTTAKITQAVTIQNNTTNTLTISDAAVNIPGVEVQLKELQPGRVFNAALTFPEGFEIAPGQQGAFTAKSSNPQQPMIRVPISQMPRGLAPQVQGQTPPSASAIVRPPGLAVPQPPHAER